MLENFLQQKRKNKMELFLIFVIVGIAIFVGTSLAAILFLLQENDRLGKELEENEPPF
jgi:flagellar basal body-associated protein FliL